MRPSLLRVSCYSLTMMAKDNNKIVEGVFAVNKPQGMSSAQVIRELQTIFKPSTLFAPWLDEQRTRRYGHKKTSKRLSQRAKNFNIKLGHGGTLDPLATGVLTIGVGHGTKALPKFLNCTKTYEAVILFGTATESYDRLTKIIGRKDHSHITEDIVERALDQFRGKLMQRPPIFSALRMNGKRLYEYAREGEELPKEIEERPVEVIELELVKWMPGGTHIHQMPPEEALQEDKEAVNKILQQIGSEEINDTPSCSPTSLKRSQVADIDDAINDQPNLKKLKTRQNEDSSTLSAFPPQEDLSHTPSNLNTDSETLGSTNSASTSAPAARVRLTVTSGFYVRSFAHDLGKAVGSVAHMSELTRIRQERFEVGKNVLEWEDMSQGENFWGPRVEHMLDEWTASMSAKEDYYSPGDLSSVD